MTTGLTYLFRALAIGLALVIAWQSLLPAGNSQGLPHLDKLLHFIAYGGLAGAMALGWPRWPWLAVVCLAALIGLGVEAGQYFMALGRTASGLDALANTAGAMLGAWTAPRLFRRILD